MKKTKSEPSAASLREMPEVEVSRYRARRNPYAVRIAREGIEIAHDGPSTTSLAAMPEADFARGRPRRNPYASRATEPSLSYGRGRPAAGTSAGPTQVRSLRLPQAMWDALESQARKRHTTVHALLRELVVVFVDRASVDRRR